MTWNWYQTALCDLRSVSQSDQQRFYMNLFKMSLPSFPVFMQLSVPASSACALYGMRSGSVLKSERGNSMMSWTWLGNSGPTWRRYWARSETPKISWKTWRTPEWTHRSSNNRLRLLRYGGGRNMLREDERVHQQLKCLFLSLSSTFLC